MFHRLPSSLTPAALAFALVLGSAGVAAAQAQPLPPIEPLPAPEPPAPVEREGFLLGISGGFGSLDAGGDSVSTLNYHLEIGGFLSHQWAIAVGFWGGQHNEDFGSTTHNNAGLMAQYWLSDAFWLKGAIGTASLSSESDGFTFYDYNGMAIAGGGLGVLLAIRVPPLRQPQPHL